MPGLRSILRSPVTAGVALVVTAGGAGLSIARLGDDGSVPTGSSDDRDLVSEFAVAVTSFDHRTASQDIDEVLALGTKDFEGQFRQAMGENFLSGIEQSGSISQGNLIAGPTLQSEVDGSSTFLVVVNQSIVVDAAPPADGATTTSAATAPRLVRVGMLVTVDEDADKVSSVEVL